MSPGEYYAATDGPRLTDGHEEWFGQDLPRHQPLRLVSLGIGTGGVDEHGDEGRRGDQLMQEFEPLRPDFDAKLSRASHVTAWSA